MGVTEALAQFVSETTYDDLLDVVVDEAKRILLETIAVTLFGSRTSLGKTIGKAMKEIEEIPQAMRIGIGDRVSLKTAAFYNTALADTNDSAGGYVKAIVHPGKNVAPVALTVASSEGKKWQRFDSGNDIGY